MRHTVTVDILQKPYQVNCPPEEEEQLREAARILNERMQNIKQKGTIIGLERIAILTALNLSYDYLTLQEKHEPTTQQQSEISRLSQDIDKELRQLSELS